MNKIFSVVCMCLCAVFASAQSVREVKKVIERFSGGNRLPVSVSLSLDKQDGCDVFETSVKGGTLRIAGSSGVAACRGFYEYVKRNGWGLSSWTGNRLEWPETLAPMEKRRVVSPFKHHYYLNVVTYGYTMPYWDWNRWEREIDWMALHGVDMPLALVANEAISARVWKKLGLTDEEIAGYFVGPAHLPWMRMGNLSGIDGPLTASWHEGQIALQYRILKRMRALGMKPICPGFAGFVPRAIQRLYPKAQLIETAWCGGVFHNWMLSPDEPLFGRIGRMFVEEWEKEFGPTDYYIADSFNEMEVPFPPKGTAERYERLATYGEAVYESIKAGNPKATWVMQGWMFGYQRSVWDYETLQALVSRVPDDKMLLLDLAVDYNRCFWRISTNWDFYKGFFNKEWVYSVIPNMGGKTGMTGVLDFYANGRLEALRSPEKGRLAGYGMAPEGIENNEVIYELVCDGGWSDKEIDLDTWLDNYSLCRYGQNNDWVREYWKGMRKSVYGSFTDHPRYNWQFRPGSVKRGSIRVNDDFFAGIEQLGRAAQELGGSPLYVADMIEMTAQYAGAKMERLVQALDAAYQTGDRAKAAEWEAEFEYLAAETDRLLCSHPVLRLENWLDYARRWGQTPEQKDDYEQNARRIVTIWGPPVDDYSARIWSGLLRDYYLPRWKHYFEARQTKKAFDFAAWERDWVENRHGLSAPQPYAHPLEACLELLKRARRIRLDLTDYMNDRLIGNWWPSDFPADGWTELTWNFPAEKLASLGGVVFQYTQGHNKLEIAEVTLELDGKAVCRVAHPGETGLVNARNTYLFTVPDGVTANNSCRLRAKVRSDGRRDSYGAVFMVSK